MRAVSSAPVSQTLTPPEPVEAGSQKQLSILLPFEERSKAYNIDLGYWETNEEPELHRKLLKGRTYKRAAAVASGGEISLLTLLPHVEEQLILVDHSYHSLAVSMVKAVLLKQRGARKTKDLFLNNTRDEILRAFREAAFSLPTRVREGLENNKSCLYTTNPLRREWNYIPLIRIEIARKRLPLVSFVHGDFRDLKDDAPFDFLYVSNAFEYSGRLGRTNWDAVRPLLKVGGELLMTSGSTQQRERPSYVIEIASIRGFRTDWTHSLYKMGE